MDETWKRWIMVGGGGDHIAHPPHHDPPFPCLVQTHSGNNHGLHTCRHTHTHTHTHAHAQIPISSAQTLSPCRSYRLCVMFMDIFNISLTCPRIQLGPSPYASPSFSHGPDTSQRKCILGDLKYIPTSSARTLSLFKHHPFLRGLNTSQRKCIPGDLKYIPMSSARTLSLYKPIFSRGPNTSQRKCI